MGSKSKCRTMRRWPTNFRRRQDALKGYSFFTLAFNRWNTSSSASDNATVSVLSSKYRTDEVIAIPQAAPASRPSGSSPRLAIFVLRQGWAALDEPPR
jgi:hypothetical protein